MQSSSWSWMKKVQLLLLTHKMLYDLTLFPQYLGHIQCRRFFKFLPHTYLQTAAWVIPRLELCRLQTCFTNLRTEISLTFELWPFVTSHFRLHALILCPLPFLSFLSRSTYYFPNAVSEPDHIKKVYCSACKQKKTFYLFVLMGKSESLYGGLDRSTVHTAQPVFQLQKLL